MSKSEVSIAIPDDLIKTLVLAEVSAALGKQDEIIAAVVRDAVTRKENSYDRQTVFEKKVHEQIGKVCEEALREWIEANAKEIKAALMRELTKSKKRLVDELATCMLKGRFYVRPTIGVQIGPDETRY